MSDYMFMLESHLTGEQYRLVGQMQAAAAATGLSLYLTGGAMRDVLGGFPVRDLDFKPTVPVIDIPPPPKLPQLAPPTAR